MLRLDQIDKALSHPELSFKTRKMLQEMRLKLVPLKSKNVTDELFRLVKPIIKSSAIGSVYVAREPNPVDVEHHYVSLEVCHILNKKGFKPDYFNIRKKLKNTPIEINGPR